MEENKENSESNTFDPQQWEEDIKQLKQDIGNMRYIRPGTISVQRGRLQLGYRLDGCKTQNIHPDLLDLEKKAIEDYNRLRDLIKIWVDRSIRMSKARNKLRKLDENESQ